MSGTRTPSPSLLHGQASKPIWRFRLPPIHSYPTGVRRTPSIERLPETTDPTNDLVDMAIRVFRRLALEHPVLYRIAFQRVAPALRAGPDVTAARQRAFAQLQNKIRRLERDGTLGRVSLHDATVAIEAMMEGLANAELRGRTLPILSPGKEKQAWRRALTTLIRGFRSFDDPR